MRVIIGLGVLLGTIAVAQIPQFDPPRQQMVRLRNVTGRIELGSSPVDVQRGTVLLRLMHYEGPVGGPLPKKKLAELRFFEVSFRAGKPKSLEFTFGAFALRPGINYRVECEIDVNGDGRLGDEDLWNGREVAAFREDGAHSVVADLMLRGVPKELR